jgi:hypothetical protein
MMHAASPIVAIWRLPVRTTDDTQATVTLEPGKPRDQTVSVGLQLQLSWVQTVWLRAWHAHAATGRRVGILLRI